MDFLPSDVEDIINEQKECLESIDKYINVMNELKNSVCHKSFDNKTFLKINDRIIQYQNRINDYGDYLSYDFYSKSYTNNTKNLRIICDAEGEIFSVDIEKTMTIKDKINYMRYNRYF